MFRTKTQTHGEVIGAELQESLTHLGAALSEAGRAAAEQLGPRVAAAREAAGPALDAAQKAAAAKVAPKVAAAVAVAAHREVVVGAEEGVEAGLLGPPCNGQQVVVGGALLRFGEDA